MRVVWSAEARDDPETIIDYIAQRNIAAAEKIESLLHNMVEGISIHPFLYKSGRVSETREAVLHPNYIVVYCVGSDLTQSCG